MKNKGFTMVELLGVITLMAILIGIAVPSVTSIAERMRTNMFCKKVDFIETGAQLWGQDNYNDIFNSLNVMSSEGNLVEKSTCPSCSPALSIKVSDLLEKNYLKKDDVGADNNGLVVDPRDKSVLNDSEVIVFIKNTRIYANYRFAEKDESTCD